MQKLSFILKPGKVIASLLHSDLSWAQVCSVSTIFAVALEQTGRFVPNFHRIQTVFVLHICNSQKTLATKNKMAANLTYLLVFASSFELIYRLTPHFHQIGLMHVFYACHASHAKTGQDKSLWRRDATALLGSVYKRNNLYHIGENLAQIWQLVQDI